MPDRARRPRAFRVAYDGRPFNGFQRQPDVPTVEDTIFGALRDLGVCDAEPTGYSAAGRTDAGVSALAQTIVLEGPDWLTPRAFNGALPEDVRVWAAADVKPDFHATHDASWRTYTYFLHSPTEKTDTAVRRAVTRLAGRHDFHNFTSDRTGTERDLSLAVERDGEFLVVEASATGFPRHMVRKIAGLLREIAEEEASPDRIDRALGPESLDGPDGIAVAPGEGLLLRAVAYPDVAFAVDPDAAADARAVFGSRRVVHATRERVAGALADEI